MQFEELKHVGGVAHVEAEMAHLRREEGEVGRCIIQNGGEHSAGEVRLQRSVELDASAVRENIQRRDHGEKNADKYPTDFAHGMEGKIVRFVNVSRSYEIRS